MRIGQITTPFGRRPATLALVKRQIEVGDAPKDRAVDKWKVFRDVCEARSLLGLNDRPLAVLNALLSFYPKQSWWTGREWWCFPPTPNYRCVTTAYPEPLCAVPWLLWWRLADLPARQSERQALRPPGSGRRCRDGLRLQPHAAPRAGPGTGASRPTSRRGGGRACVSPVKSSRFSDAISAS